MLSLASFLRGRRGREGTNLSKSRSIDPFQRVEECRAEAGGRRSARGFLSKKQRQKNEGSGSYPSRYIPVEHEVFVGLAALAFNGPFILTRISKPQSTTSRFVYPFRREQALLMPVSPELLPICTRRRQRPDEFRRGSGIQVSQGKAIPR
jgi:hypothetical protein